MRDERSMTIWCCRENDNAIKLIWDEGNDYLISEIQVGCFDVPSDGWSVIGIDDLTNALKAVGYTLTADWNRRAMPSTREGDAT